MTKLDTARKLAHTIEHAIEALDDAPCVAGPTCFDLLYAAKDSLVRANDLALGHLSELERQAEERWAKVKVA